MNDNVREFCRQECIRQYATTDDDYAGMESAWDYAFSMSYVFGQSNIDLNDLRIMASKIDATANPGGRFRTGPAVFMNGGSSSQAGEIEYRLTNLIKWLDAGMTPDEFYQTLMWIHPFKDGNGRVGALVYNWLNGTLDNPVPAPEYK